MSRARVIYITSAARSGSTLLDRMLSAHPFITSVGEALQLRAYALEDRALYDPAHPLICSCGKTVPLCPFWQQVASTLGSPLASLRLRPRLIDLGGAPPWQSAVAQRLVAPLRRWPALYRWPPVHRVLGGPRVGHDSFALYDAVACVTGARYVLDSSKVPFRFWSIHRCRAEDLWLLILSRDYRAVAFSQMKRGRSLLRAAKYWVHTNEQIETLSQDVAPDRIFRLRYEDLCDRPEAIMQQLCSFLQLGFNPALLSLDDGAEHHIGGSPSKFDRTRRTISRDVTYLEQLTPAQLRDLRGIVGEHGERWGYR